jgi:hypothetical protein
MHGLAHDAHRAHEPDCYALVGSWQQRILLQT